MESVKKSISEILNILDEVQETMNEAYKNVAIFYTSLKEKDINQAYFFMLALKNKVDLVLEKLNSTVDHYEVEVLKELKEEEEDGAKEK